MFFQVRVIRVLCEQYFHRKIFIYIDLRPYLSTKIIFPNNSGNFTHIFSSHISRHLYIAKHCIFGEKTLHFTTFVYCKTLYIWDKTPYLVLANCNKLFHSQCIFDFSLFWLFCLFMHNLVFFFRLFFVGGWWGNRWRGGEWGSRRKSVSIDETVPALLTGNWQGNRISIEATTGFSLKQQELISIQDGTGHCWQEIDKVTVFPLKEQSEFYWNLSKLTKQGRALLTGNWQWNIEAGFQSKEPLKEQNNLHWNPLNLSQLTRNWQSNSISIEIHWSIESVSIDKTVTGDWQGNSIFIEATKVKQGMPQKEIKERDADCWIAIVSPPGSLRR